MSSTKTDCISLASPALRHGGDIERWCEHFQISPGRALDFSASINPLGPPAGLAEFLSGKMSAIRRYPDAQCEKLIAALSRYTEVPGECLLAGNGSMEMLDVTLRALQPKTVRIVEPAFSEYAKLAAQHGAKIIGGWGEGEEGREGEADLIFAAHPGNPKGNLLDAQEVKHLLEACRWLVIDEAFIEFAGSEHSYIREAASCERLIVIRSATKFFAIPGLRLGYLAAHPEIAARLKQCQMTWSVNILAQEAMIYALQDNRFPEHSRKFIEEERGWLSAKLTETGWLRVFPSAANFLLCEIVEPPLPKLDAPELFHRLGEEGIFIRPCHNFEGLGARYFRVSVRTREENEKLLSSLSL
ncbi:MAG: threonine-phosphate decarboxylase [Candidatus Omnitrophica bacterium]|nr:threonine-phosphate decarboxylase [Candidatus Omnitrophota bacterium]